MELGKVKGESGFESVLKSEKEVYVLFYASWCPFCQKFLPVFKKFAENKTLSSMMIEADERADLSSEYSIEVVPTVLLFKEGRIIRRLDGVQGEGLTEAQLREFARQK